MSRIRHMIPVFLAYAMFSAATLSAQVYTDLHDFNCTLEGCGPAYPAIMAQGRDGNLYGTLEQGGTSSMGTVFRMTPAGVITTLYNFSGLDGQNPDGGLVLGTDGNFYGTTRFGGASNLGTVFKITPAGKLTILHSFIGSPDGSEPRPGLVLGKSGAFYGTTCGFNPPWTAYSITPAGKFTTIVPNTLDVCSGGPLTVGTDGNLYGTGQSGGINQQGSVFRLTPAGALTDLFNSDVAHGDNPVAPVVQGNDGNFYGTMSAGGAGSFGVVFRLTGSGTFTALHSFGLDLNNDGLNPDAGLVAASDGKLYGATSGGEAGGTVPNGNLFSITTGGTYKLLYAFDGTHGSLAQGTPMQHTNGKIYGLADSGGPFFGGAAYSLDNGAPPFVQLVTRWAIPGQSVQILGQGLSTTTQVTFGTAVASFNVVSDTFITAIVPANGTSGLVTVTTASGSIQSNRKFFVVPAITGFSPTSGPVGTQVTITGVGFLGTAAVRFGGIKATTFTVNSETSITATVPTGAATGKIQVTTAGGTGTSTSAFTVTP